jgi:hypothetical protein
VKSHQSVLCNCAYPPDTACVAVIPFCVQDNALRVEVGEDRIVDLGPGPWAQRNALPKGRLAFGFALLFSFTLAQAA